MWIMVDPDFTIWGGRPLVNPTQRVELVELVRSLARDVQKIEDRNTDPTRKRSPFGWVAERANNMSQLW